MSAGKKMTPEELCAALKKIQEPKGYFFNHDQGITLSILGEMLELKEKYGYLVCPCRLSSGKREQDADILCPCVYREEDVKEYGFCYCGLYMDEASHQAGRKRVPVPERRPVEKSMAALL